ncbi:MAG: 30S ribosomal protein S6 [Victivallaceae bacterium]|nr:30S ribosomal protein S6 [Victivallaceae bacterium]NLK82967.1 30S ribosomal protein S6 [Lentisphaerota bacterium]MDD3115879.1 30S ribosomal protein S6 [Victivallaceae bacterium]MDD3703207.1 30S ribosomal protein S6 [Victivallaceae bacterium]MDD4317088.1 30S ribosomal protein S6 [Victivallaceae bacterium]
MKKYEAIFILDIRKVEDEGEAFSKEFAALIEGFGGKMEESVAMGRIPFAYEINRRKAGIYWNFVFELDADKTISIKEKFKLDERVLRDMIIVYDRPSKDARTKLVEV